MRRRNIFNKVKNIMKTNKVAPYLVLFLVVSLSIGYSAFSSTLNITGIIADIRVKKDVRITGVTVAPETGENSNEVQNNGGIVGYTEYNVSNIQVGVTLPNQNSSVTLNVEVTNIGNVEAGILEITGLPDNLDYEMVGDYELKDKICDEENKCSLGIRKVIPIKIKYKDGYVLETGSNTYFEITADFNFQQFYSVTYSDITNNGYPTEVMATDTLVVDFGSDALPYLKVMIGDKKITDYTYSGGVLTIPNVNGSVTISNGLNTYSGTYLTLNSEDVLSYKIYGNSVQNGTPTPENPIEIQSIGERTNNLIDLSKVNASRVTFDGATLVVDVYTGNSSQSTGVTLQELCPDIEVGKTYYIYYDSDVSGVNFSVGSYSGTNLWSSGNPRTITEADLTATVRIGRTGGGVINLTSIQVTEEETDVYEPYGKYKIPVEVKGKNMLGISNRTLGTLSSGGPNTNAREFEFDKYYVGLTMNNYYYPNNVNSYSVSGNSVTVEAKQDGYGVGFPIKVKPNTTYSISKLEGGLIGIGFYTSNGEYIKYSQNSTFTTSDNCEIITVILRPSKGVESTYTNIQLEENTTATTYEPYVEPTVSNIYIDEPLRKIGNYADYIDFESGKIVRQVSKIDLSNYVWASYTKGNIFYYISGFEPIPLASISINSLSNILPPTSIAESTDNIGIMAFSSAIVRARPDLTIYDTVDKWQEYVNNNNSYLLYVIGPTENPIDLPTIITHPGTTIITAGGAEIELTAKSK